MNLYLDQLPELVRSFSKTAAFASRLSDKAENWPQELTSELYRQLPFLSDYDVNVNLDRVEPQKGFAFGYADIANKTERPEAEHTEAGLPHVRIPLVIMDKASKPFSVFLDGDRVLPLNEERVREILFNPGTFDLSTSQPKDPSLVEPLMPPQRSSATGGGGGEIKTAAAQVPGLKKIGCLLLDIAPTIRERDAEAFVEKVASDPTIRAGFMRAGITPLLVETFDNVKRASADDRLQALADRIEPSVVTLHKLPGGAFLMKCANVDAFDPSGAQGQTISGQEAGQAIGDENAQAIQPGQTVTAVADPSGGQPPAENKAKVIEEFGQYKVQDMMGNSLVGHVFPQMIMWDGTFQKQQMALFTNGSAYAMQDTVAGELVGKGAVLPVDVPRGDGCFYYMENGDVCVTAPVTVGSSASGPDGLPRFMASDAFGNQLQITQLEELREPQRISDQEFALPSTWKFMRLNNQTQLIPDPSQMNKTASYEEGKTSITLFYNGGYHVKGGCGLEKISRDLRYDLDPVGAEFVLGLLGVDGITAKSKIAEARKKGSIKLAGLKTITTLAERYAGAEKTASALLRKVPDLRRDLTKEAAAMPPESPDGTVDNVLALNFINPENLSTFVSYIPELEQTGEHLAEMLLFSYIGMKEVPEGAIERAMRNIEEVVSGLKKVAYASEG